MVTLTRLVYVGICLEQSQGRFYVALPRYRLPGRNRMFLGAMVTSQVVVVGLLLTVVLGVAPGSGSAPYQVALFVYLCLAAVLFLRLAVSLLTSQKPAAS